MLVNEITGFCSINLHTMILLCVTILGMECCECLYVSWLQTRFSHECSFGNDTRSTIFKARNEVCAKNLKY